MRTNSESVIVHLVLCGYPQTGSHMEHLREFKWSTRVGKLIFKFVQRRYFGVGIYMGKSLVRKD